MSKPTKNHCLKCKNYFISKRNPNQQYCSQSPCQNARKQVWRNKKLKSDPDYIENRDAACKAWRKQNSHYWAKYRKSHPDYRERNYMLQKARNMKRGSRMDKSQLAKSDASLIANSDALNTKMLINTGRYRLTPHDNGMIANSDALIVNIAIISRGYACTEATVQ